MTICIVLIRKYKSPPSSCNFIISFENILFPSLTAEWLYLLYIVLHVLQNIKFCFLFCKYCILLIFGSQARLSLFVNIYIENYLHCEYSETLSIEYN
jgi:hypothetical protein